ncbi:hypothetical protein G9A89_021085 [Geosiphon pyriformis]|nr:hypothetical protein G9A89_021085 [Geosiphon pyriformis]
MTITMVQALVKMAMTMTTFSDNDEGIMPEQVHDTDTGFDLRYPGKNAIKLEPNARVCIDLKIALEIPATIMVLLVLRSSLAKKGINIRGGIVDAEYTRNISAMLQNDSEKVYTIEPNEKIAQTIFLPLVKVASLVEIRTKEELEITARGIQEFGSTGRIDVPVNMAEEEIADKGEIISTSVTRGFWSLLSSCMFVVMLLIHNYGKCLNLR